MEQELRNLPKYRFKNTGIDTRKILVEGDKICSGTIVYVTKFLKGFFDEFAPDDVVKDFMVQDIPLILNQSRFGEFAKCEVDALAVRDLIESASRSMNIEKIDKTSKSCMFIRQRFINLYEDNDEFLLLHAELLYHKKMLRRYAKVQPDAYLARLKSVLCEYPRLIFLRNVIRSMLVYTRNVLRNN